MPLTIEYTAEPLAGHRAQLHVAVFVDGAQQLELSHPVGSPAPADVVRARAEDFGITIRDRKDTHARRTD